MYPQVSWSCWVRQTMRHDLIFQSHILERPHFKVQRISRGDPKIWTPKGSLKKNSLYQKSFPIYQAPKLCETQFLVPYLKNCDLEARLSEVSRIWKMYYCPFSVWSFFLRTRCILWTLSESMKNKETYLQKLFSDMAKKIWKFFSIFSYYSLLRNPFINYKGIF